jgi:hypothetical protein
MIFLALAQSTVAAEPAKLCGGARLAEDRLHTLVLVEQRAGSVPVVQHAAIEARSADGEWSFHAAYDTFDGGFGGLRKAFVNSQRPRPTSSPPRAEKLRWQFGGGDWQIWDYWTYPHGSALYVLTQSPPVPIRTGLIPELNRGGRLNLVSRVQGAPDGPQSTIDIPTQAAAMTLLERTRAKAVATLKPCEPPLLLTPAKL